MEDDVLAKVEEQRAGLQDQVTKLRTALRHWQTWEIEYEGLKEEILILPSTAASEDMLKAAQDFEAELVDENEIRSLLGLNAGKPRSQQQVADVISRRIDYVNKNAETIRKQLTEAEKKRNALLLVEHDEHRDDAGLPLVEITEELDEDGNVISASTNSAASTAPKLIDVLQKAGVREILENDGIISTVQDKPNLKSTTVVKERDDHEAPTTASKVLTSPLLQPSPPTKSDATAEMTGRIGQTAALTERSYTNSVHVTAEQQHDESEPPKKTVAPTTVSIREHHVSPLQPSSNTQVGAKEPFEAQIPSDESEDDSTLRREMIDYQSGLDEVGAIVAELQLEEGSQVDSEDYDIEDLEDFDDLSFDDPEDEDSEDEYGRSKKSPLTEKYHLQMAALEKRLDAKGMQNLGPTPNLPDEVRHQLDQIPRPSTTSLEQPQRPEAKQASVPPPVKDVAEKKVKHKPKKQVSFAEELDIAPSVSGDRSDVSEAKLAPPQDGPKRISRFKKDRLTGDSDADLTSRTRPPPMSSSNSRSKTLADTVVERQAASGVHAPSFGDIDERVHKQEIATEFHALRSRMIHRQGGFVEERELQQEKVPLTEDMGGQKMSRFKAARLKGLAPSDVETYVKFKFQAFVKVDASLDSDMEGESHDPGLMEVVPYDTNREIVLRHDNAVVVYDPASHQLVLQSYNDSNNQVDHAFCPTCQRPFALHDDPVSDGISESPSPGPGSGFRNPDYFRMVQRSLQAAADPTVPSTPHARLVQPRRTPSEQQRPPGSPLGTDVSNASSSRPVTPEDGAHGISSSAFSQNFLQKVFIVKKELGRGGRGVVFLVEHVLDGVPLGHHACKRIPVGDDHKWLEKVLVEVQLLSRLHHQNLVAYQHVWLEKTKLSNFGPPVACAYILQEYCNSGDLQNYVIGDAQTTLTKEQLKNRMRRRSKGEMDSLEPRHGSRTLQFDEIYSFFRDMTAGIQFLHENGFIHRDLKPSNCLLHRTNQGLKLLVSDFGEVQEQNAARRSTGTTGTISYCAPEVLRRVRPGGPLGNFSFKSDIFSLGMILYFICFASLPYANAKVVNEENEDLESLRAEVSQWTGFKEERRTRPELPEELYVFLRRLLAARPEDRPTADEVAIGIRNRSGLAEPNLPRPSRTPPPMHEELTPRRRIVPLDSPASTPPKLSPVPTADAQSTSISRARQSRLRQTTTQDNPNRGASVGHIHTHSQSPHRELVLRRTVASPERESSEQGSPQDYDGMITSTYLLTDSDSTHSLSWWQRCVIAVASLFTRRWVRFLLVILKVISVLQPCASRGMNSAVTYPLLLLALWDFGLVTTHYALSVIALAVHCCVLALTIRSDTLCTRMSWGPDELT